jgi:hypothetical protein
MNFTNFIECLITNMNEMSDSDKILFHQWIISEDANAAFTAWKTKQLKSLDPLVVPHPRSNSNKSKDPVKKKVKTEEKKAKPEEEKIVLTNYESGGAVSGFSGPVWDEHVRACRRTGRDPYD